MRGAVALWARDTRAELPNRASRDTWPSVQAARTSRKRASVPVRFAVGRDDRELRYDLIKDDRGWRLDDIGYDDGRELRDMLEDALDR